MNQKLDIVDEINELIYNTEDAPGLEKFCSLLEDAANEIRKLRGLPEVEKQY